MEHMRTMLLDGVQGLHAVRTWYGVYGLGVGLGGKYRIPWEVWNCCRQNSCKVFGINSMYFGHVNFAEFWRTTARHHFIYHQTHKTSPL